MPESRSLHTHSYLSKLNSFKRSFVFAFLAICSLTGIVLADPLSPGPDDQDKRKDVHWGALPYMKYSTDQGFSFGFFGRRFDYGLEHRLPFENLLTLQGSYATQGPFGIFTSFEKTHLGDGSLRYYSELTGSKDPFSRYYGLGDQTLLIDSPDNPDLYFYTRESISFDNTLRKTISPGFDIRGGLSFMAFRLYANQASSRYAGDFGTHPYLGLYTRMLFGVTLERRNFEFIASKGYYLMGAFTLSPAFLGTEATWYKAEFDFRYYISLIENRWLWLAYQFRYAGNSASAPLMEKVKLGSQGTLRGLPLNRFLSNHSASLRADIRSVLLRTTFFGLPAKGGIGFFADMGQIGDDFGRLFTTRTHFAYGISAFGSYFMDDFLGGADVGFSEGNVAFYVGLGHAF